MSSSSNAEDRNGSTSSKRKRNSIECEENTLSKKSPWTRMNDRQLKSYYTIVAPDTIHSDYDYAVTATIHDSAAAPITIKIGISGPSYNETKTIEIPQCGGTEIVHFNVPPALQDGDYFLQAEGVNGLIFKESAQLMYKSVKPSVYIQTDKASYKPGDLVQYRIMALDENIRPAKLNESLNLFIRDAASNQIKEIKDIQITRGIYTGNFQLSEQPVLGNWIINVTSGVETEVEKATKEFEVAKYILPKFSVEIEAPQKIAFLDKVVKITVRSKYTYGKPVKGKITVSAKISKHEKVEKTLDIYGKGELEFNLIEDLYLEHHFGNWKMPDIKIKATMTEAFTGLEQSTSTIIYVRRSRYTITILNMRHEYDTHTPFEIRALIKKLNGFPVTDAKSTAKLTIAQKPKRGSVFVNDDLLFESNVDPQGIAIFKLKLFKGRNYSNVKVMYEEEIQTIQGFKVIDVSSFDGCLSEDDSASSSASSSGSRSLTPQPAVHYYRGFLQIHPQKEEVKVGEEIVLEVTYGDHLLPYFVYTIMAKGKIIKHEYVKGTTVTHINLIKLKATFEMVPKARVFVYFVKDGRLHYDSNKISIPQTFENKLEITAPEEAIPSDVVTLNIKTEPNSFVGLLGVDQRVLLLKSGNDFIPQKIFSGLQRYERCRYSVKYRVPGMLSGFITLTNALYELPRWPGRTGGGGPFTKYTNNDEPICDVRIQPQIRKNFAEVWIFDNIESTDSNGIARFTKTIPDTITSWVVTGFSLNENTGFAMTENPTKIRVFQPFFLSISLPYSIKRGEVITIPVTIFNYTEANLDTEITMTNEDDEYDFTGGESASDVMYGKRMTKKLLVSSQNSAASSFTIRPKIVGEIMLKIKAITTALEAGDAVYQKLKVEPEGETQYTNEAFYITLIKQRERMLKHTFKVGIPTSAVLDSEYLEFTAVGDILGPTIKNLDKLVRMPFGCGEQNMINFVPNILVLQYLEALKLDMPVLVQKAKKYMETGYQRQLTYKHKNGSYSAFGERFAAITLYSKSNSWLTAYVARSFLQARKFITIDEKIIDAALQFLIKTQKDNGHFPQTGKLFCASQQNELGGTAFILLALLEDKVYALKYKNQIKKALTYLADNVEQEDDIYALALTLLVFQKARHPRAKRLKNRLELKSNFENNLKWWSNNNSLKHHNNNVEITAYMLQSLVQKDSTAKLLPIIKWLIGQRNNLGGFCSTQDTVVGLKALVAFAEKYAAGGDGKMTIQFEAQNQEGSETTKGTFNVDKENSLLLQSHVLPKSTRQVTLIAEGKGSCLIQLSYRYNIATASDMPTFLIKHTPKQSLIPGQLLMNICAEFTPSTDEIKESNMSVMEISLPSGYTTYMDNLKHLDNVAHVQRIELQKDDTVIVIYFDSLVVGEAVSFDVSANKVHAVYDLKPAAITIYDYYNTEQRATIYYEVLS